MPCFFLLLTFNCRPASVNGTAALDAFQAGERTAAAVFRTAVLLLYLSLKPVFPGFRNPGRLLSNSSFLLLRLQSTPSFPAEARRFGFRPLSFFGGGARRLSLCFPAFSPLRISLCFSTFSPLRLFRRGRNFIPRFIPRDACFRTKSNETCPLRCRPEIPGAPA